MAGIVKTGVVGESELPDACGVGKESKWESCPKPEPENKLNMPVNSCAFYANFNRFEL